MENKEKKKRIQWFIVIGLFATFIIYILFSIYSQSVEINKKMIEIKRLEKELRDLDNENKSLNDPEYIKNEFRKKYNYVEGDEKIINFPDSGK